MSQALAPSRSLVSLALPESGATRLVVQGLLVLSGTLALALSAKTRVVLGPVDLSLQSLVIMLIAASFGMKLGVATLLAYLAEGAMGLPVFQGTPERGIGLAYMMGTTGGYLLGFVLMAAMIGYAADRGWDRNPFKLFSAILIADALMIAMGFAWLAALIGIDSAWTAGVMPFLLPDLVKVGLAACLIPVGWSALNALGIGSRS